MPALLSSLRSEAVNLTTDEGSPYRPPHHVSSQKDEAISRTGVKGLHVNISMASANKNKMADKHLHGQKDDPAECGQSLHNGLMNGSPDKPKMNGNQGSGSNKSLSSGSAKTSIESKEASSYINTITQTEMTESPTSTIHQNHAQARNSLEYAHSGKPRHKGHTRAHSSSEPKHLSPTFLSSIQGSPSPSDSHTVTLAQLAPNADRISSSLPVHSSPIAQAATASTTSLQPAPPRLHHRHTLEVPRLSTSRTSKDSYNAIGDSTSDNGRFTPSIRTPRASNTLARAHTRSIHSDMYMDEGPHDDDIARWTENIRQKRASRRRRKEEEEEDRVVVGTKVDVHHVNWVTAYNMLTGIRFTVSRINAKIDRQLVDADFDAKHKFSFDITGNELTPSARYDFKFKDYAPWVFRHLRARFQIDPADYLISLTSKYILSELGSPGKSGSFFYFSRDYKYIIKTIHHAEHKLLRRILREYHTHIEKYPNTLISQFYGLHRVKIPYGRKIHFVIMNNLFPPHRDIHQTFDLKGSTVGRDFKEEDLADNPRATLKDLNWLRRNYHFEFGPQKKMLFVEQMKRDVSLLQRLKIMDYSLLVGIHDLNRGNEENLRDKTLKVFQPGAEEDVDPHGKMLTRTPSKLDSVRQAKQLRQIIKRERPVPMDKSTSKMPDEMLDEPRNLIFYSDDGGFQATHEDGSAGEEIYYLGVIDCLTHYGIVKRAEHLWKGLSANKSQISPIPPEGYGERFIKFISGLTMTKEEAERQAKDTDTLGSSLHINSRQTSFPISRSSTDKVIKQAEKQAITSEKAHGHDVPKDRTLSAVRSPSIDKGGGTTTLPIVEEDGEATSKEHSTAGEISQPNATSTAAQTQVQTETTNADPANDENLPSLPRFDRLSMGLGGPSTKAG